MESKKIISGKKFSSELGLEIVLFVLGFSIPFSSAFNSICIGVLFVYSFFWFKKKKVTIFFKNPYFFLILIIVFYILQVVGITYSVDIDLGIFNVRKNIVFLLMPITFINLAKIIDYKKVKASIYGLIIGVTVILISAYLHILAEIFRTDIEFMNIITHFLRVEFVQKGLVEIHPPYLGLLVVFVMASTMYLKFSASKRINLFIRYVLMFFFLFSLYSISSFMSLILVGAFFLACIIALLQKNKLQGILLLLGGIGIIFIFIYNIELDKSAKSFNGGSLMNRIHWSFVKGKGDTSRPDNWKSVLLVVKENLFFGVGPDGGLNQLQKQRSEKSESYKHSHNAHNQYLEVLLRHGAIGLALYLFIIFQLIRCAIRSKDKIFIWFLIVFVISSMTESYLQRQIGLTFFVFYALMFNTFYSFGISKKDINEKSLNT